MAAAAIGAGAGLLLVLIAYVMDGDENGRWAGRFVGGALAGAFVFGLFEVAA